MAKVDPYKKLKIITDQKLSGNQFAVLRQLPDTQRLKMAPMLQDSLFSLNLISQMKTDPKKVSISIISSLPWRGSSFQPHFLII